MFQTIISASRELIYNSSVFCSEEHDNLDVVALKLLAVT
jgi:hypothetical protein